MPSSPPRLCRCGGKVREGVCDRCGPKRRAPDVNRKNSHQRGYDHRWREFRRIWLSSEDNCLCRDCLDKGIVNPATDIHHKVKLKDRPDLKYEDSNLVGLCHDCHSVRTAKGE
jgi:5-methylcytosine-specific restriction protein A